MRFATVVLVAGCTLACHRYEPGTGRESSAWHSPAGCYQRAVSFEAKVAGAETPPRGEISGRAIDETGRPIRNALVRLVSDTTRVTTTDSAGRFLLMHVPHGEYRFEFIAVGYNVGRTTLPIGDDLPRAYRIVAPTLLFDGPCMPPVVAERPWWKWW